MIDSRTVDGHWIAVPSPSWIRRPFDVSPLEWYGAGSGAGSAVPYPMVPLVLGTSPAILASSVRAALSALARPLKMASAL